MWSLASKGRAAVVIVVAGLVAGCEPTFKPDGSVTIDGAPFRPTTCRVLTPAATGIVLTDASGARLELVLPPARLDAFQELHGTPRARYEPAGRPALDLGTCGSLTLRGEGYHASSKRAASGRLSLACSGKATVSGDLTFAGCF